MMKWTNSREKKKSVFFAIRFVKNEEVILCKQFQLFVLCGFFFFFLGGGGGDGGGGGGYLFSPLMVLIIYCDCFLKNFIDKLLDNDWHPPCIHYMYPKLTLSNIKKLFENCRRFTSSRVVVVVLSNRFFLSEV